MPETDAANQVRALEAGDIAAITGLFQRTFRNARQPAPDSLKAYLTELFLNHHWHDPDLVSRVYIDGQGKVGGFIGVLPARLVCNAKPVRAAIAGSLMVDNPAANPLAGARLLRSFLAGPQDLSISETANAVSMGMWERLGHTAVPAYSMDWLRIMRPAGFAVAGLAHRLRPARILAPAGALADTISNRIGRTSLRPELQTRNFASDKAVGNDELIAHMPQFIEHYDLRPDWDADALAWVLEHAARKERHGEIVKRMVYARSGAPLGFYIYYKRPRDIGWVLQIMARADAAQGVVDSLLDHAWRHGCVALRRRSHPQITGVL
ncbi:MAG: hypothetical protein ACC634_02315, partial [Hyphomicrobiales bacterium]